MNSSILKYITIFLSITMVSCYKKPNVEKFEGMSFEGISDGNIDAIATVSIKNPNGISVSLDKVSGQLFYKDKELCKIYNDKAQEMTADKVSKIDIPALISMKTLSELVSNYNEVSSKKLRLVADYAVSASFFNFNIHDDSEIKLPSIEEIYSQIFNKSGESSFKIEKVSMDKISLEKTNVKFEVVLENKFDLDYEIKTIDLDFYLDKNKNSIGTYHLDKSIKMNKKSKEKVNGAIEMNNLSLFSQGLGAIFGDKKAIVKGNATIIVNNVVFDVPILQSVPLPLG